MPIFEIVAAIVGLAGSYLVYVSWKQHSTLLAFSGWGCLLASLSLWIMAQGAEYGLLFGLFLPGLFVWIGILSEQKWQVNQKTPDKPSYVWRWQGRKVLINLARVLYMFPVLMVISSLITITLAYQIPVTEPTQMAIGIIVLPMLWGLLAHWYLVSLRRVVPLLFSFLGAAACGIVLFG